jgi:hypothetical protein
MLARRYQKSCVPAVGEIPASLSTSSFYSSQRNSSALATNVAGTSVDDSEPGSFSSANAGEPGSAIFRILKSLPSDCPLARILRENDFLVRLKFPNGPTISVFWFEVQNPTMNRLVQVCGEMFGAPLLLGCKWKGGSP